MGENMAGGPLSARLLKRLRRLPGPSRTVRQAPHFDINLRLLEDDHVAAILRPGCFVRAEYGRPLLAVADRLHPTRIDAQRDQVVPGRRGATLAESQVVLARAALVAMAFDHEAVLRIGLQPRGLLLKLRLRLGGQIVAIRSEEHAIADVRLEIIDRTGLCALRDGRRGGRCRGAGAGAAAGFCGFAGAGGQQQCRRDRHNNLQSHLRTFRTYTQIGNGAPPRGIVATTTDPSKIPPTESTEFCFAAAIYRAFCTESRAVLLG